MSKPALLRLALASLAALSVLAGGLVLAVGRASSPGTAQGPGYVLEVLTRDGMETAPAGTTVTLMRYIDRNERAEIERTGTGPAPCATATTDAKGLIEITVKVTPSCPAGSDVTAIVDYHDGSAPISASIEPQIAWRDTGLAGVGSVAVVRPVPPPASGTA
jgi:hypothetical protein